tara:strand:+ start:3088 stop:3321 length:234 start_codon:yes stop_codon:yes gene_type:complete
MPDVQSMYDDANSNYLKESKACKTLAERKMLMKTFAEDLKDIALLAEIQDNDVIVANCERWLKSIRTRSYKGSYKSY